MHSLVRVKAMVSLIQVSMLSLQIFSSKYRNKQKSLSVFSNALTMKTLKSSSKIEINIIINI